MEVLNPRGALLSNYEVLRLLRDMEKGQVKASLERRRKSSIASGKRTEGLSAAVVSGGGAGGDADDGKTALDDDSWIKEVPENLRTVQFETIAYLSSTYLPTTRQSEEGVLSLMQGLRSIQLTKVEKLQLVNLAPQSAVELHTIVEDLEDRFDESMMDSMIHMVSSSLSHTAIDPSHSQALTAANVTGAIGAGGDGEEDVAVDQEALMDAEAHVDDELIHAEDKVVEGDDGTAEAMDED